MKVASVFRKTFLLLQVIARIPPIDLLVYGRPYTHKRGGMEAKDEYSEQMASTMAEKPKQSAIDHGPKKIFSKGKQN